MPLNTEVRRGSRRVTIPGGWDYTALSCFLTAAVSEVYPEEELREGVTYGDLREPVEVGEAGEVSERYADFSMMPVYYLFPDHPLWRTGSYVLRSGHRYVPEPGRVIELREGDTLRMWRN